MLRVIVKRGPRLIGRVHRNQVPGTVVRERGHPSGGIGDRGHLITPIIGVRCRIAVPIRHTRLIALGIELVGGAVLERAGISAVGVFLQHRRVAGGWDEIRGHVASASRRIDGIQLRLRHGPRVPFHLVDGALEEASQTLKAAPHDRPDREGVRLAVAIDQRSIPIGR